MRPDRAFFDRGDDDGTASFPADTSSRTVELTGSRSLVGRYSRSQRLSPEIDLSAPPRDPGVSRSHALIERRPDGTLAVTDLGSSNGTWIGPDAATLTRLEREAATPLEPGTHIYLGSWTRITLHRH